MLRRGQLYGIAAALLFGVAAPLSKLLLPGCGPLTLAGLLYLGAGLAMVSRRGEARVSRADVPWLALIIAAGGIAGPSLLLFGLQRARGLEGSLLLNLETPLTMALAVLAAHEHLSAREVLGGAVIVAGSAILGLPGSAAPGFSATGALLISAACACWAVDNVLTARISLKDPAEIVRLKALPAAAVSLLLGRLAGEALPSWRLGLAALVLGAFSYGLSLAFNVRAQRELGAARQAALFATAPFAGALLSVPLLGDRPGAAAVLAGALMAAGVALVLRARHEHLHRHEPLEHEHVHTHDAHHQHAHEGPVEEPHSHPHRHVALTHAHPHASDAHHRHTH